MPEDNLARSEKMKRRALAILEELELFERWSRHGRPVLVGALSFDLILTPDIDMEIYCPKLEVAHGMEILLACSRNPHVVEARYQNELSGPDKAIYWQLKYRDELGELWKVDMWSAPADYELPRGENFVEPMRKALTPETRRAILDLKAERDAGRIEKFLSIDLYRAVLEGGVRDVAGLRTWTASHKTGELSSWQPARP